MTGTIEDRLDIQDLIARFALLCDTGRFDRVAEEIFAPDASVDYGSGVRQGRAEINALFASAAGTTIATSHHISNMLVRVTGDTAWAHVRVIAFHWHGDNRSEMKNLPPADQIFTGGYEDELIRTPEGWRIQRRRSAQLALVAGEPGALRAHLSQAADRQPLFSL